MPFFSINGTPVEIDAASVSFEKPIVLGVRRRSYNNTLRSTVRGAGKRVFSLTSIWQSLANVDAIRALFAGDVNVTIDGDIVGNVPRTCKIEETGASALHDGGTGALFNVTMRVEEV